MSTGERPYYTSEEHPEETRDSQVEETEIGQ
jgi:hypothetical protein